MIENLFKVWCEYELDGQKHSSMEGPESWFLITQTGQLWSYSPTRPPRPVGKDYAKTVVLFYTGLEDSGGNRIFSDDILGWDNKTDEPDEGPFRVTFEDGCFVCGSDKLSDLDLDSMVVIGNIHENPELLTPPQVGDSGAGAK